MLFLCLYGKLLYPAKINLAWSITLRYTASISGYFFFLIFFYRRSPAEPGLTNAVREEEFRKDVNEMCNLGEGILEDGIAIGLEKGQAELIRNMHKNGLTAEQIAAVTNKNIEEVKDILENKNSEK